MINKVGQWGRLEPQPTTRKNKTPLPPPSELWDYLSFADKNPTRKRNRGQITIPGMDEKGAVRSRLEMNQRLMLKERCAIRGSPLKCQSGRGFKWRGNTRSPSYNCLGIYRKRLQGSFIRGCAARLDRVWVLSSPSWQGM